jgi:serine/threonine-protein kinase RsbW
MHEGEFAIPSRLEEMAKAEQIVLGTLERLGYDETAAFALRLALQEALSNAIVHGNESRPERFVSVSYRADAARIVIEIEDEGIGFDPAAVPDPTREENLRIPSGRGIALMRAFMTGIEFTPPCNRVRMVYERAKRTKQA